LAGLSTKRIQFTPDLMPLDITGSYLLNEVAGKRQYEFHAGPLFANMILADEINRASPKTQSALLEAMQERQVTVLGTTHVLPQPFMVLATQNPIELEGTYPLPEAQLDRFLFKLEVRGVDADVLVRIVTERGGGELPPLKPRLEEGELRQAMQMVSDVLIPQPVADYIARLVAATHKPSRIDTVERFVRYGASPRAAISLAQAARARGFMARRNSAGFEDVKAVLAPTLCHRLILDYSARIESVSVNDIIGDIGRNIKELRRETPDTVAAQA
jgi:MoxR-like ATPase